MFSLQDLRWVLLLWTFPGVVIHELAHKEFCRYYKIPVEEVCYFQLDNPAGYVVHMEPRRYVAAFMISVAPAFINTIIAFGSGVLFAYSLQEFDGVLSIVGLEWWLLIAFFACWIGISAGVHMLPSRQDAKQIWYQSKKNWYNPFVLMVIPCVLMIELLNRFRRFYFHIVSGVLIFAGGVYVGMNLDMVIEFTAEYLNSLVNIT